MQLLGDFSPNGIHFERKRTIFHYKNILHDFIRKIHKLCSYKSASDVSSVKWMHRLVYQFTVTHTQATTGKVMSNLNCSQMKLKMALRLDWTLIKRFEWPNVTSIADVFVDDWDENQFPSISIRRMQNGQHTAQRDCKLFIYAGPNVIHVYTLYMSYPGEPKEYLFFFILTI